MFVVTQIAMPVATPLGCHSQIAMETGTEVVIGHQQGVSEVQGSAVLALSRRILTGE